jgi:CrcB protein
MTPPLRQVAGREVFLVRGPEMLWLLLALGGILGTFARYRVGGWIPQWAGTWLSWGTLAANLVGSFILGLATRATQVLPVGPAARGFLTVGFCGAFTTFSTLMYETAMLLQEDQWGRAVLYAFGSLALGLLSMALGLSIASLLTRSGG